jgi:hypothetical protein
MSVHTNHHDRDHRLERLTRIRTEAELAKTKREAIAFKEMVAEQMKQGLRQLSVSKEETKIFRQSLRNFSAVCYKQRKEIRLLKKYIRYKKAKKKNHRAKAKTMHH